MFCFCSTLHVGPGCLSLVFLCHSRLVNPFSAVKQRLQRSDTQDTKKLKAREIRRQKVEAYHARKKAAEAKAAEARDPAAADGGDIPTKIQIDENTPGTAPSTPANTHNDVNVTEAARSDSSEISSKSGSANKDHQQQTTGDENAVDKANGDSENADGNEGREAVETFPPPRIAAQQEAEQAAAEGGETVQTDATSKGSEQSSSLPEACTSLCGCFN